MKSHVHTLALLFFALTSFSFTAPPASPGPPTVLAIEFQRIFGNSLDNRFNKVIREGDDYYVLGTDEPTEGSTAHATLTKLNFQGQLQWTIRLSLPSVWNDIIVTDEGNLLLVGGTSPYDANSVSLIGLATPAGTFQWVRYFNFSDREVFTKVVRHPNPPNPAFPFYILGVTQQQISTNDDINLLNIDANGTVNFRKLIGGTPDEEFFRDLEILANGDFLLAGHAGSAAVTVQVNTSGTVVSGNSYGVGMRIYDAMERPGSGFILVGSSSPANPAQVSRVNSSFQTVWSRTIPQLAFINRAWIGPDQAIYALGFGTVDGVGRNVVVKIVENNNLPSIQWAKYLDGGETAYSNGNIFFLAPDQIAYVDGRTGNPAGFGQSDAFLSISSLDLGTCVTKTGPALTMSSFTLSSSAYTVTSATATVPTAQDVPLQGVAWQQIALCGSSCEPVNTNTFSTILSPVNAEDEIELALDGFLASNGEHIALGYSTAFSPFTLDLILTRMDDEGNLISDPTHLEFNYNGGELEALIDAEIQSNAHLTEVFDVNGNSQGYLLAVTMFGNASPPGGITTLDILTALLDHSGCVVWSRFLERPGSDEFARDVIQLPNGDLVVLAERFVNDTGESSMELLRYSINGQNCGDFQFDLPSTDEFFPTAIANVEGLPNPAATVAVAGYWKSGQRYLGVYLLESDLSMATPGPLLFDMLPANPEETPVPAGIVQNGQNLVIAGYMTKNSPDREAFLLEVRPFTPSGQVDGNTQWARRIRANAANSLFGNGYRIYGLDKDLSGNLYVAGAAAGAADSFYRAMMIKTNPEGVVQWINLYPGAFGSQLAENSLAFDIDVSDEGNIMVAGYRPRPDSSDGYFWVGRTDLNGYLHNCDCFDPMTLQLENYQPEFSQTTAPEPTPVNCDGEITIPSCVPFTTTQLYCDQFFPPPLCEADFDWQAGDQCGKVGFTNLSAGPLPTYLWQFGDPLNSTSAETSPSFTYFSSGTYNVCLTITTADCSDTHCEMVTVLIAGAPATLTCPPNITVQGDPGACENTTYQLPQAVAVDNCPCDPLLDVSYSTGYSGPYPGGASTFTVTAIDGCGVVTCQVTVTVDDGEAPVIACPDDIVLQYGSPTDPGTTGEATATDPCGEVTVTFSDEVVSSAECQSTTERTWTATDVSGNTDTCIQIIELADLTPLEITCPDDITVVAGPAGCTATLPGLDIEIVDDCINLNTLVGSYVLSGATTGSGPGYPVPNVPFQIGVTLVEITVTEIPGSAASCSFQVTVTENVPPVIQCQGLLCEIATGADGAVVVFADPLVSDNCSEVTLVCDPASGSTFPIGTTVVTCTATDDMGNSASCNFTVEVLPSGFSAQFSADLSPGCGNTYVFSPLFLDPAFQYAWDFGDGNTSSTPEPEHTFAQDGFYTVTLAVSSAAGCESTEQVEVEVLAQLTPTFSYEVSCLNAAFLGVPNDPEYSWTWDLPGGPLEGATVMAAFPGNGTYEVCATVSDGFCEQTICQTIELSDTEAPQVTCPGEHISTDPGACSATYTPSNPAATDNCSDPADLNYAGVRFDGLPLDAPWPLGNNCMTWTVTDQAGNLDLCVQCITVEDEELPAIDCPDDVPVEIPAGGTGAIVEFAATTASDNCGEPELSCTSSSGDEFPLGTTEVLCTATDDAGNSATCFFYVIISEMTSNDTCCVDSLGFIENVTAGFNWVEGVPCHYTFVPKQLNGCQQVAEWQWGDGEVTQGPFAGNTAVDHIYVASGAFEVCMVVAEADEFAGDICWESTYCETISVNCGDPCEMNTLPVLTGFDYANNTLFPAGTTDPYWTESNGLAMAAADEVVSVPALPGSSWVVPLVSEGYRNHEIEFRFCLPSGPVNCQDLVFDLDIQAWAVATVRINGKPITGPLFLSPAYGVSGNWHYEPAAADCGLFREGDNRLSIELKTVMGGAGLNVAGTISSTGTALVGSPDCCQTAPECSCDEFNFDAFGMERSNLFEGNPCLRAFRPVGVEDCDQVEWYVNASPVASGSGTDWVFVELPNGAVEVCLRVTRTDLSGNFCGVVEKCEAFIVECGDVEACDGGIIANAGLEGTAGVLGQGGTAAPWLPAFGAPYLAAAPGAADPNYMVLSGNEESSDAFYQTIEPTIGQVYQLSFNVMRYLPGRPGENTRLVVRISDEVQTSDTCTGTCHTMGIVHEFSDSIWYHYVFSFLAYAPELKHLTVFVDNEFGEDGTPASRSFIQVDNICLDAPTGVREESPITGVQLFPNPTKGAISLVLPAPAPNDMRLRLYDLWGRPVLDRTLPKGEQRSELNLEVLPAAIYWVELQAEDGSVWRERMVKQ